MFSALKSAVGVSLSGEVKHAFPSFHAISAVDIDGANVDMSRYRGKVLVVANVASK